MDNAERTVLTPGERVRPEVDSDTMIKLVKSLYGMTVKSIKELNSYDDRNFHVFVEQEWNNQYVQSLSTDGYVLKILNSLDSKNEDFVDAQNQMIFHVYNHGIITSRPVCNTKGKYMSAEEFENDRGTKYIVRLFEFLPGRILEGAPYTADLLFEIGKLSGEIDKACQDFFHPAHAKHRRIWSLTEVPGLSKFYQYITDEDQRHLAEEIIDSFKREVVDHYNELKSGTIHADFGEHNVLIRKSETKDREYEVAGIIDFGDSAFTYYIFEIAINMCYMMLDSNVLDTFEAGGHTLAGYLSVFPLPQKDLQILKECICARVIQSLIVGIYSAKMDPKNSEYILKTSGRGWDFLKKLWKTPKKELYGKFSDCVSKYNITANFPETNSEN